MKVTKGCLYPDYFFKNLKGVFGSRFSVVRSQFRHCEDGDSRTWQSAVLFFSVLGCGVSVTTENCDCQLVWGLLFNVGGFSILSLES